MAELRFTNSHEWARLEADSVTIGITDYAQSQLGDIVFIELPSVGENLEQSSQFGTIESTKAASELYAPVSGKVLAINSELNNNPQWINESPLEKGWMLRVKIANSEEFSSLMDEAAYKEFIEKESH